MPKVGKAFLGESQCNQGELGGHESTCMLAEQPADQGGQSTALFPREPLAGLGQHLQEWSQSPWRHFRERQGLGLHRCPQASPLPQPSAAILALPEGGWYIRSLLHQTLQTELAQNLGPHGNRQGPQVAAWRPIQKKTNLFKVTKSVKGRLVSFSSPVGV